MSCCASSCNVCLRCLLCFSFQSCFTFLLSNVSDIVYLRSMGIVLLSIESLLLGCGVACVVPVFLEPWLSDSKMYVLLFGKGAAAALILIVMLLVVPTSIQSPSCCLLLYPCPPHRQFSFLSFTALCFGHLSSFPFSNFSFFTYSSPIFLHMLSYRKHITFLFHMHLSSPIRNG